MKVRCGESDDCEIDENFARQSGSEAGLDENECMNDGFESGGERVFLCGGCISQFHQQGVPAYVEQDASGKNEGIMQSAG